MGNIKIMDENLSNKINAGEVIEKCSSIVKELVENSIDAGAKNISIELVSGGLNEIKVIDDACGMDNEDAKLAFFKHSSSKLTTYEDLYRINTMGFRGEALPSIASVSSTVLETYDGKNGIKLHYKGGILLSEEVITKQQGTTITIRNLFYNTPARLKHLSSSYSEVANIASFVQKISLTNCHIAFKIINDGKVIFNTSGTNDLLKVINQIYGLKITKDMIYIKNCDNDFNIEGYISNPTTVKNNRRHMNVFVNNRIIRNNEINRCIIDAYHTHIMHNQFPIIILKIDVDPHLIDVNIHPNKMEVKFSKIDELKTLILETIKSKLLKEDLVKKIDLTPKVDYEKIELALDFIGEKTEKDLKETQNFNDIEFIKSNFDEEEKNESREFPNLYVAGIVFGTYLICQNEIGMYLIDIHAAKERVNYENIMNQLVNKTYNKVSMIAPLTLELTNSESIILQNNLEFLNNLGFEIEEFGFRTFVVKSHPTWIYGNISEKIKKTIELVIKFENNFDVVKFNEEIAINMSCKMSIKANTDVSIEEGNDLIKDLKTLKNPYNCPHGRPTIISFTKYELEKMFKRAL
ncbi:MAG: DNA mismatch repair endonuclease MutL [Bacilli bacterium]